MNLPPEVRSYVISMMQQGYGPEQIRAGLQQAGWDTNAASQIVAFYFAPQQSKQSAHPLRKATLKRFIILLVACLLVGGGVTAYMFLRKDPVKHEQSHQPAEQQSRDITNQPNMNDYTEFTQLKGATFLLSKKWTTRPRSEPSSYLSIFNFDPAAVESELKADDRYPRNANFYHDIKRRDLKTYPYSLDKMYEIQILSMPTSTPGPLTEELVRDLEKDPIEDLQMYKVNNTMVVDYISKPSDNSLAQRSIVLRNQAGTQDVAIVINPNQSRDKITKENFDGLMELIGSIKFVP